MHNKLFTVAMLNILEGNGTKRYFCLQSSGTINTDKNVIFIVSASLMIAPL